MAAALIDLFIRLTLGTALTVAAPVLDFAGPDQGWILVTALIVGFTFVLFAYDPFFETVWNGKSPGKALMGLRVVTNEGAPIRFRHAFIRGAIAIFEILLTYGVVAVTVMIATKRTQRLGDMVAGTVVFRERQALKKPQPISFQAPAGTEELMSILDTTGLRPSDYTNIRSFLVRAPKLLATAREGVASSIVAMISGRLNISKPADMPNETFLVCVAASYQGRFRHLAAS